MPELDDPMLEQVLRRHVAAELNGQLGRCASAFERHLQETAGARPSPATIGRGRRIFTIVGTALAASIAGVLVAPRIFHQAAVNPGTSSSVNSSAADSMQSPTIHFVENQAFDEGTVIRGGAPARKVRRVQVEQMRWSDVDGRWELTVPHEEVQYMELDPY